MNEWLEYPKNKPKAYSNCLVCNDKYGGCFSAIYKSRDIFILENPNLKDHPVLQVTHFIQIPVLPKLRD